MLRLLLFTFCIRSLKMNLNHSAMNYNLGAGASGPVAQRSLFEPELGRVCWHEAGGLLLHCGA